MNCRRAIVLCRHRGRRPRGRDALAQDASQFPSRNIHIMVPNAAGGGLDFFARLVGGEALGPARQAGRGREPRRRQWQSGRRAGDEGRAGRAHAAARLDRHAHGQSGRGREPHLRYPPRFRADLDDRQISADPDGERQGAGEDRAGARRLCQGQSGRKPMRRRPVRSSRWCRRCSSSAPARRSQYIAFRANSEAMMALMRGDALMSLSDVGPATGPLQDGRVRALAVTSPQRLPSHPDVPTMAEAGFKDMEIEFWTGLLAPAKTPAAIVQQLEDEIMAIVKLPDVVEKFAGRTRPTRRAPPPRNSPRSSRASSCNGPRWRRRATSRFSSSAACCIGTWSACGLGLLPLPLAGEGWGEGELAPTVIACPLRYPSPASGGGDAVAQAVAPSMMRARESTPAPRSPAGTRAAARRRSP